MSTILQQIDNAFITDLHIDEIGIIPKKQTKVDDTEAVDLIEHKLGISSWALKPLFSHCLVEFFKIYHLVRNKNTELTNGRNPEVIKSITRSIMIVKGDMPLALSLRKELIENGMITLDEELNLMKLIFQLHPKSPSLWQHRRWCICYNFDGCTDKVHFEDNQLQIELNLCSYLSDVYPKNYYSWVHRLWLLNYMDASQVNYVNFFIPYFHFNLFVIYNKLAFM